jgi:hypothetical protein
VVSAAEPYRLVDGKGGWLEVRKVTLVDGDRCGVATSGQAFIVDPAEIPAIARAMYEACGQQPPVILGRPDTSASGTPTVLGTIYPFRSAKGARVAVGRGTGDIYLEPGHAREIAAILAACADEAEPEPDPADVDALAAAIHAGTGCCDGAPSENHRSAARTALRWMKDREAGRG